MKIAIMGTGGLGSYIGGMLLHAGLDVALIARGAHLQAIREQGLQIQGPDESFTIYPAQATNDPTEIGPVDLIFLCVKSYSLAEVVESMHPLIGPDTAIIPVLNGISHIEQISDHVGAGHLVGGMAMLTAHRIAPGVAKRLGNLHTIEFGELGGGHSQRCEAIQAALAPSSIKMVAVPNVIERMWWKLAGICGIGVFSVARGNHGKIWEFAEIRELCRQAIAEVVEVANAQGIPLSPSLPNDLVTLAGTFPPHYQPSMLVDLERGNPLEVASTNGAVSRLGRELGVATPVNDVLYAALLPHMAGEVRAV
jgi:2-dehydropantoate 2-reductase